MSTAKNILKIGRRARIRFDPRIKKYRPPSCPNAHSALTIAVVGGGIAGLAAAWQLKTFGHTVFIYEAQNRPGGRIYTIDIGSIPIEVGAARISDRHARALYWVKNFGLQLELMYPKRGRLVRLTDSEREVGQDAAILSNHDVHNCVSHQETWPRQFDSRTSLAFRLLLNSVTKPTWYRIKGGNAQLPARIADELKDCISYNSPVKKISQVKDGVEVSLVDDDAVSSRKFDKCIMAVPPSTQSDIAFDPPLSSVKQRHIASIQAQPSFRAFALIRNRSMLDQNELSGFGCTSQGFEIWQPSFTVDAQHMVLVLYAQGEAAESILSLDCGVRRKTVLDIFERMFPGVGNHTVEFRSYSWVDDPWARGAQTLFDQQAGSIREALRHPEGCLHFAGEHTTGGWIDDALASADRVVEEVCLRQ